MIRRECVVVFVFVVHLPRVSQFYPYPGTSSFDHQKKSFFLFEMNMMIVVPGADLTEIIQNNSVTVIGGGLSRLKDGRVITTLAGPLLVDVEEQRCWVGETTKRHIPLEGDVIIGVIVDDLGESYSVDVKGPRLATLDALAFDGASRRNSPSLNPGSLVFARVIRSAMDAEPQITCEAPGSGKKKDWTTGESQFGELKGGCVFQISRATCRRLSESNAPLLQAIGKYIPFEVCIGFNGQIWVNAEKPEHVVLVGAVLKASEGKDLSKPDAESLVKTLVSSLKGGG